MPGEIPSSYADVFPIFMRNQWAEECHVKHVFGLIDEITPLIEQPTQYPISKKDERNSADVYVMSAHLHFMRVAGAAQTQHKPVQKKPRLI